MEEVMVVPTEILKGYLSGDTFISSRIDEIILVIRKKHLYIPRDYAETAKEYNMLSL